MGEEEATMREKLIEAMRRAMATSQGHSDEGNIGMLIDELDRTENNNRIIIRAAATAALDAALDMLETPSEEMVAIGEGCSDFVMPEGFDNSQEGRRREPRSAFQSMLATLRSQ